MFYQRIMLIYISEWMTYLMTFTKKKTLGINIDIIYRLFCIWFFLKGETKTPNGDVPNPDDPFGDDEDHEKLAALAKSFEEKYVS